MGVVAPPLDEPTRKYGRLAVISDGRHFRASRVIVVPDDGSEPIDLPVFDVAVAGDVNDFVRVKIEAAAVEIDLRNEGFDGERLHIAGKTETPGRRLTGNRISITGDLDRPVRAKGFIWRFGNEGIRPKFFPRCRLYLKGRRD